MSTSSTIIRDSLTRSSRCMGHVLYKSKMEMHGIHVVVPFISTNKRYSKRERLDKSERGRALSDDTRDLAGCQVEDVGHDVGEDHDGE
mgnify:CR=1 FL=1